MLIDCEMRLTTARCFVKVLMDGQVQPFAFPLAFTIAWFLSDRLLLQVAARDCAFTTSTSSHTAKCGLLLSDCIAQLP